MQPFLSSARRYRWLILAIVVLVWGASLTAAYVEYKSTYESDATIWVLRASQDLSATNPNDPGVPVLQTAATQQVELLSQLLQTKSVLRDVAQRTPLRSALASAADEDAFFQDLRKHFRVQALGSNMISVSFTARDPHTAAEVVKAALAVREERVAQAGVASTSALSALYRREFELAQTQALDTQKVLDDFTATHTGELSPDDSQQLARLRLSVSFAQARLVNLLGRIDQAELAPLLIGMSGMEFQIVDQPRENPSPMRRRSRASPRPSSSPRCHG
jgi:uncharacterized protein involved in exopolysaccharide biosynthesis